MFFCVKAHPPVPTGNTVRVDTLELTFVLAETSRPSIIAYLVPSEVIIGAHSPWQNPYAERIIGSIRRECLDHLIVLSEEHLYRILGEYFSYYNESRRDVDVMAGICLNVPAPLPGWSFR